MSVGLTHVELGAAQDSAFAKYKAIVLDDTKKSGEKMTAMLDIQELLEALSNCAKTCKDMYRKYNAQ
jgi:hypothetical protein